METFYILIYQEIFKENAFVRFLINNRSVDTLKQSFCPFIISQTLISFEVENIILYSHLSKYVSELTKRKSIGCKQKYNLLDSIYRNRFLDEASREKVSILYCRIQRRYLAFCRFAYLWKLKRAHTCVDSDLYLNAIEPMQGNSFVLFQNNKKYCFIISDLMKTLEYAICHEWEDDFEIICKKPCNPYNKEPFLKHDLLNIYFHMRFNMQIVIPSFFHLWFLENFDLPSFLIKYRRLLRKICIKHHVFNASNNSSVIYKDVRIMLFDNNYTRKWLIHEDFPKDKLVDLMRPYLYIFYLIYYDVLEYEEQEWYEAALTLELMKCYKFNPLFGRRIIKPRSIGLKMNHVFWGKQNRFALGTKVDLEDSVSINSLTKHKYVFNMKTLNFCSTSY